MGKNVTLGGTRKKSGWWKAKERGVWGEAEGVVGAKRGVLLGLHCLGKKKTYLPDLTLLE